MSDTNPVSKAPALDLNQISFVLGDPARWLVLRELAKGEALPPVVVAARIGRTLHGVRKHLASLRKLGVVVVGYGRLYSLAPAYRPAPGATVVDLGHGVVRLDTPLGNS